MIRSSRLAPVAGWLCCCFALAGPVAESAAQESAPAKPTPENASFEQQAVALRTALHYDPSLESSLGSLVSLYQKADRIEELIGLYRGHLAQYPDDPSAKAVLIQILQKLNRIEADEMIQAASLQHPDHSLIQFLLYQYRERRQDEGALESLSKAVDLEKKAGRRDAWLELLLEEAGEGANRALAEGHLKKIRAAEGHTVETLLSLADRMHRFGFHELALATLEDTARYAPSPEAGVEIEVLAARCQASLGDRTGAGVRLESLIGRLAPDYWRRSEIMSLRINLLSSDVERKRLLSEARIRFEASPENESVVLEYAELLYASEERAEAARVLVGACEVLPNSERIEIETLKVLDRLGDDRKLWEFLTARLEQFPERRDLRYRLVKSAFLLGKKDQATEDLDMVLDQLDGAEERQRQLLDLARFLRRAGFNREATVYFGEVLTADPGRFDIRRELAETHLANNDRFGAALMLRELPIKDASIENFIDLVQFMMGNEFLLEARQSLEKRLKLEPGNFELRLHLVDVLGKTGDRTPAEALLDETRKLADTPARYARWLETGLGIHELFDDAEKFFDDEQARFFAGNSGEPVAWTPERIENFLNFCEIGKRGKLEGRVTQVLRNQLAGEDLPVDLRIQLRKLLVKALEKNQDHAAEVEQQLKLLAEEDNARADEYELRRALLYHTLQRPDLAQESLGSVTVENVRDVAVLRSAAQVLVEYGMFDKARACLEGVTTVDPTDLNNWERRMTLLAALGKEDELRKAMRHLLAGVDQINLSSRSLEALQFHLLDSYWRTIARLLADGSSDALAEIFPFLEAVEREPLQPQDRLWSLWVRAYALNALGRNEGREAAIGQLVQLAETAAGDAEPAIAFPDGLTATVSAAVDLLRDPPGPAGSGVSDGKQHGPLGGLEMAWAFESDPGSRILQLEPIPGGLLILDDQGTIYRVDVSSGKLLWRERFGLPEERRTPVSQAGISGVTGGGITISNRYYQVRQQGASISVQQLVAPYQATTLGPGSAAAAGTASAGSREDVSGIKLARRFETDGERFYLPFGDEIQARSIDDGSLVWAAVPAEPDREGTPNRWISAARPGTHLIARDGRLLAFFPESGVAAAFDAKGGKLVWRRELPAGESASSGSSGTDPLFSLNSGASFSEGRLFVYGNRPLILDAESGKIIWSFEAGDVRSFPVDLIEAAEEDQEGSRPADPALTSALATALPEPSYLDHLSQVADRPDAVKSFLQYRGALVAPAVHWAGNRLKERAAASAVVDSGRILLMGSDGVRRISLRLPLASHHFEVYGTFLGLAGARAWFLDGAGLTMADLNGGEIVRMPAAGEGQMRAFLSGSRIYVIGDREAVVLNAHTGSRITELQWPADLSAYRDKRAQAGGVAAAATGEGSHFVWQGVTRQRGGFPSYCFPGIDRAEGPYLFMQIDDSRIAAVRSREPKPETPAP